ncbi:hypothetical protein ACFQ08_11915 [Streptosporangium algeriense]|uniref:Uncharacterized protein n=1 Tax=Streptosporangium algeriense TaxID=1682748 RepID=A0ABW3DMY2_9ACTN
MTGPEHYSAAEKLLVQYGDPEFAIFDLAAAQAHATLALAAATAQAGIEVMDQEEFLAWDKVCGGPS